MGETAGVGAGFDDVAAEREPVDDGGAQAWIGEGFAQAGERLVGGVRDTVAFFPFGEDLEEHLGAAAVELHVAELVDAEQIDAAVAGDGLGQHLVIGCFAQLVGQPGVDVLHLVAGFGGSVVEPARRRRASVA